MIFNPTEKQEQVYLQQVLELLKSIINNTDASVKKHVDTLAEYKDYLWSNKDIDPHEIRSMRESILNHFALGENVIHKRKRLGKILDMPYFGRIDFREEKEDDKLLPVYIGIHSFYDPNSKTNLIYDWRSPIASMFYDYELGKASYIAPAGEVKGNILLKRQYRIRNGKMEFMIESSLTVHDDILQKELSANADDKMKNIVATIQREQNRIVRNENAQTLIIQGVAGSGKTSIALHRIAFLLYRSNDGVGSIKAELKMWWNFSGSGYAVEDTVTVSLFAIEMVYIPQGSFMLGDGVSPNTLYSIGKDINVGTGHKEDGENIDDSIGYTFNGVPIERNPATLPALGPNPMAYPTGFGHFYLMKHEISQHAYVDFLNSLNYENNLYSTTHIDSCIMYFSAIRQSGSNFKNRTR